MRALHGAIPAHVLQRVGLLRALDAALRDCLPADCGAHCRATGLADGTLFLVADSPVWRTRLHFHSPKIIRHFNRLGKFPVSRVKIRVGHGPEPPAPAREPGPARTLPPSTARALRALADETGDPELQRALRRLARHGRGGRSGPDGR